MFRQTVSVLILITFILDPVLLLATPTHPPSALFSDEVVGGFFSYYFDRVNTFGKLKALASHLPQNDPDSQYFKSLVKVHADQETLPKVTYGKSVYTFIGDGRKHTLDVSKAKSGDFQIDHHLVHFDSNASLRDVYAAVNRVMPEARADSSNSTRLHGVLGLLSLNSQAHAQAVVGGLGIGNVIAFYLAVTRGNGFFGSLFLAGVFGWLYVLYALTTPAHAADGLIAIDPICPQQNNGLMQVTFKTKAGDKTISVANYDSEPQLTESSGSSKQTFQLTSDWTISGSKPDKGDLVSDPTTLEALKMMAWQCKKDPNGLEKAKQMIKNAPAENASPAAVGGSFH